jgi:hypothetical protein
VLENLTVHVLTCMEKSIGLVCVESSGEVACMRIIVLGLACCTV